MTAVFIFLLGLGVGSFLNVLIFRLPLEENFVRGRSYCPDCRHSLAWKDLIPLISFLVLKKKCRYCSKKISGRYFWIELMTGTIFLLFWPSFFWLAVISLLIVLVFIDFDYFLIPDKILVVLALLALSYQLISQKSFLALWPNLLAGMVAGMIFLLIFAATKGKKMGLGDVKLMALLGFIFGFPPILLIFYLAVAGALAWSVILILFFGGKLETKLPFGSLLAGSAVIFILFNQFFLRLFEPYVLRLYT